jgi:hypothetical protein
MAKQLKDILAGTRSSKTVPGNLGKDPGVDYEPKAGDEQKFAALHVHQKHEYPHGNETLFTGAVDYSLNNPKEKHHGNTEKKAEKAAFPSVKEAVESKKAEDVLCNSTSQGTECPVHGMVECMSARPLKEISTKLALSYAKGSEKSMDTAAAKGSAGHETFIKRSAGHKLALDKTNPEHKRLKAKVGTTDANAKDAAYKKSIGEEIVDEAMSPKQKQHANRVKTMPGKKGNVMAKSNFEAPVHKVHAVISKNGGAKETVKHEVQAKDKHDAMFNIQMMHHKAGHKVHDTHYKGIKEEVEQIDELSTDLLHRAAHKAAKLAMSDVQGRSGPIFKKRAAQANKFRAKGMEQEKKEKAIKEETDDKNHKPLSNWPKVHAAVHRSFSQAGGTGTDLEKKELGKTPIHPDHHAAHNDAESDSKKMRKVVNRHYSHDVSRGLKEDIEQIDELSPATMKSYVQKAGADKRDSAMKSKVYSSLANTLQNQSPKDANDVRAKGHDHYANSKKRGEGIKLAKKKLGEENIDEVLTKSTSAGETIHDFVHSKNPQFAGKSKEKRKQMALAAYYQKKNEEVEILEDAHEIAKKYKDYVTGGGSTETASRYKSHVNMLSKKTGEHPDNINKQVRKHVKNMKEDVHGSSDTAKYKTNNDNDEIEMVRTELKAIANKTMHMLSNMPTDHHIEPWVQAKIAAAKEMIGSVHDYMMFSDKKPEEDEQTDTPITFPNMANDSAAGINV